VRASTREKNLQGKEIIGGCGLGRLYQEGIGKQKINIDFDFSTFECPLSNFICRKFLI